MSNRLAGQTSPYLLQHAGNPVDWWPWGPDALALARDRDRPIFLSIGYAACHWCHVMERETFEDPEIAAYLNEHFVSIKVDREERPDIDEIYMNAVQLLTGSGGWPLTAFLTPGLRPFAGGTYFPPQDRHGRIGFRSLLERIVTLWKDDRDRIEDAGAELTRHLEQIARTDREPAAGAPVGRDLVARAIAEWTARFDPHWGGFGAAPKFPPDAALILLLREARRGGQNAPATIARRTLEAMACGGLYDQVGGGFARYSVDERWLVPHFEKMLYNQALLVPAYLEAWSLDGAAAWRRVVEGTLDFVRREMTDPGGGFWSSLDADSEGVEGKFYVWTPAQLRDALGDADAARFAAAFDVTEGGNFEGASIPNRITAGFLDDDEVRELAPLCERLRAHREQRVRPATDDKVLTSWNGLMISAFADAHRRFGRESDLLSAQRAASFLLDELTRDGRLLASWRAGAAAHNGYLDDYAFFGRSLLDLYETDFDPRWREKSERLARSMLRHFSDAEGNFFFTSDDHEPLLTRSRSTHDGALPSGVAVAVGWLDRLAVHLGDDGLAQTARRARVALRPIVDRSPAAFANLLLAVDVIESPRIDVAIAGAREDRRTHALVRRVRAAGLPAVHVAVGESERDGGALLHGREALGGRPTAYPCVDGTCRLPTADVDELSSILDDFADASTQEGD